VPPHLEARAFAMAHLAMDEAVAAASAIAANEHDRIVAQRAAVIAAAQAVLEHVFPSARPAISALANRHLAAIQNSSAKARGTEVGRAVAERVLNWRQHDRWVEITVFNPPVGPVPDASETTATALAQGGGLKPSPWLQLVPFALKTPRQFGVREVRTINRGGTLVTDPGLRSSRLFKAVDEGAALKSREQFWAQRPLIAWNRIARQLSATRIMDLPQQARMLAVLNAALADATVSSLHWRHTLGSWRMVVADMLQPAHETSATTTDVFVTVDNGYETERMRVQTQRILIPPTSNYPSLIATSAGAAQAVLAHFFETDRIEFTLPEFTPAALASNAPAPRTFSSVSAAARENAFVASLDGRHSRESCIAGFALGTSIGGYISKRPIVLRR
jgi:hypothetical protein